MAYVIAVVAVILLVALVVIALRRRTGDGPTAATDPTGLAGGATVAQRPDPEPMTGLESALAQVTDADGRSLREHLDAETGHVDELRVPDDTGPLLRRALDHVEHRDGGEPPTDTAS